MKQYCRYCGTIIGIDKYGQCPNCYAPISIDYSNEISRMKDILDYEIFQNKLAEMNLDIMKRLIETKN